MKKIISLVSIGFLLVLSGCFDIKEEIYLEKNGSGKYVSTIDMSQLKEMLTALKAMMPDTAGGGKDEFSDLNNLDSLQQLWKDIDEVPGITDVKREKKDDMVFVVSFRFADIKALNTAMTKRNKSEDPEKKVSGDFFTFSSGNFACNDTSFGGLNDVMKGMNSGAEGSDSTAMALSMMKGFMGDMKYTSIYHLPGKVSSYSNKDAKLSEDGKTVTLEINFSDTEKPQSLQNRIQYKK